jgi:hypothetical protein
VAMRSRVHSTPPAPVSCGALLQQGRQAGALGGGQPAASPRRGSVPEGFWAPRSATRHPLAARALADTQGRGDLARRPAVRFEVPGL